MHCIDRRLIQGVPMRTAAVANAWFAVVGTLAMTVALGCGERMTIAPGSVSAGAEPLEGTLTIYVATYHDGHSETWHVLRTADGSTHRLQFAATPDVITGD